MSDFTEHLNDAVQNAVLEHLKKGNWIQINWQDHVQIKGSYLEGLFSSLDHNRIRELVREKLEEKIAEKIIHSMATEVGNDVKSVVTNAPLRENLRFMIRDAIRDASKGVTEVREQ